MGDTAQPITEGPWRPPCWKMLSPRRCANQAHGFLWRRRQWRGGGPQVHPCWGLEVLATESVSSMHRRMDFLLGKTRAGEIDAGAGVVFSAVPLRPREFSEPLKSPIKLTRVLRNRKMIFLWHLLLRLTHSAKKPVRPNVPRSPHGTRSGPGHAHPRLRRALGGDPGNICCRKGGRKGEGEECGPGGDSTEPHWSPAFSPGGWTF